MRGRCSLGDAEGKAWRGEGFRKGCGSQVELGSHRKLGSLRKAGRSRASWGGEDPNAHLVKGPLLMCVLGELVNKGIQLLWDDHASREDRASRCWCWPLHPSLTLLPSPSPQVPPTPAPWPHLRVSTGRGSKLPSASTVAFFSALEEYEAST